jgi:hypothetical protein
MNEQHRVTKVEKLIQKLCDGDIDYIACDMNIEELYSPAKAQKPELECQVCKGQGWYAQQVSDTEQEQRRCDLCDGRGMLELIEDEPEFSA